MYAAVVLVLIVGAGAGGYLYYQNYQKNYQNSLQPNVQVTNPIISKPIQTPNDATVVSLGRVSYSGSFNYSAVKDGSYELIFDNSFSTFSSKNVAITYDAAGALTSSSLTVPAGNSQQITVQLKAGQRLSGSFTTSGGSGNDVNFEIVGQTCSESIAFSFDLANTGTASGSTTAAFQADGQQLWSNKDLVAAGQQVPASGTATLPNCADHSFGIVVIQQQKV
jgi:hypothetical protein